MVQRPVVTMLRDRVRTRCARYGAGLTMKWESNPRVALTLKPPKTVRHGVSALATIRCSRATCSCSSLYSINSVVQLAAWISVSSSRLSLATSSIRRRRGATSTVGKTRISARPYRGTRSEAAPTRLFNSL